MAKNSNSKLNSTSKAEKEDIGSKTRVVGIVSGKGGVGKTTFSANIGIALNAFGFKTLVIDCNVTTPHLGYYIGAKNFSTTINNIFAGDIDAIFAPIDKNGLMFIPASEKFEDLKNVDMKDLKNIIKRIADTERFEFIILDSAPGLGREAMGALHACDEIIFVTKPTAPNVMDVARCDEVARMLGHKKFHMVFNMVRGKKYELLPEKAEEMFDMDVLGSIPFDENIMDSTAEGVPIMWYKPGAPSCDHFMEIAANLAGININELEKYEQSKKDKFEEEFENIEPDLEKMSLEERARRLSDRLGRLEPIIDSSYQYMDGRSQSGLGTKLRKKIDGAASGLARRIKGRIWRR